MKASRVVASPIDAEFGDCVGNFWHSDQDKRSWANNRLVRHALVKMEQLHRGQLREPLEDREMPYRHVPFPSAVARVFERENTPH